MRRCSLRRCSLSRSRCICVHPFRLCCCRSGRPLSLCPFPLPGLFLLPCQSPCNLLLRIAGTGVQHVSRNQFGAILLLQRFAYDKKCVDVPCVDVPCVDVPCVDVPCVDVPFHGQGVSASILSAYVVAGQVALYHCVLFHYQVF